MAFDRAYPDTLAARRGKHFPVVMHLTPADRFLSYSNNPGADEQATPYYGLSVVNGCHDRLHNRGGETMQHSGFRPLAVIGFAAVLLLTHAPMTQAEELTVPPPNGHSTPRPRARNGRSARSSGLTKVPFERTKVREIPH